MTGIWCRLTCPIGSSGEKVSWFMHMLDSNRPAIIYDGYVEGSDE
jgi:hypothetical protein